jgi:GT2 family glycosyltransferase
MFAIIYTVILNWLDTEATAACLRAIAAQTRPPAQTIVVHNGPETADLTPLEPVGLPVRLLRPGRNLGFTGGVNLGLTTALAEGADYVWLLNSDAEPAPDALARLVGRATAEPRAGLVAPAIRNASDEGRPDFWGGLINPAPLSFRMSTRAEDYAAWAQEAPDRIWLAGAALLVSRRLVEAIGGLDEHLFAYWDDHDYSLRSARAGFRNLLEPAAIVAHRAKPREDAAPTKPPYYYYYVARNHVLLLRKHGGLGANLRPLLWNAARQLAAADRLRTSPETVEAICAGLQDGLAGRGGEFDPTRRTGRLAARLAPRLGRLLAATWLAPRDQSRDSNGAEGVR